MQWAKLRTINDRYGSFQQAHANFCLVLSVLFYLGENQFSLLIIFCHFRVSDYIFVYFSLGGVFSRDEQQFRVRVSEGQARSSLRTSIFDAERQPGLPYSIFVHYSNTLNECALPKSATTKLVKPRPIRMVMNCATFPC